MVTAVAEHLARLDSRLDYRAGLRAQHPAGSDLGAGLLEHQAALNELALTDEQQPEPQRSSMDDTSAWMAQMEQQLVLSTADRARVLAQAAAASPALDRSSVKPGDKLCKRTDPSSTGDVLKLHDEMDMAQVDFSEAGGSKVRMFLCMDQDDGCLTC